MANFLALLAGRPEPTRSCSAAMEMVRALLAGARPEEGRRLRPGQAALDERPVHRAHGSGRAGRPHCGARLAQDGVGPRRHRAAARELPPHGHRARPALPDPWPRWPPCRAPTSAPCATTTPRRPGSLASRPCGHSGGHPHGRPRHPRGPRPGDAEALETALRSWLRRGASAPGRSSSRYASLSPGLAASPGIFGRAADSGTRAVNPARGSARSGHVEGRG